MNHNSRKQKLVLAIAASTRGFGFAVFDGESNLVEMGIKIAQGDKNVKCLAIIEKQINFYAPTVIILGDYSAKGSRRCLRVRQFGEQIKELVAKRHLDVALFSNGQIRQVFSEDGKGTKQAIASVLALRFGEDLGHLLPPERKLWTTTSTIEWLLSMQFHLQSRISNHDRDRSAPEHRSQIRDRHMPFTEPAACIVAHATPIRARNEEVAAQLGYRYCAAERPHRKLGIPIEADTASMGRSNNTSAMHSF